MFFFPILSFKEYFNNLILICMKEVLFGKWVTTAILVLLHLTLETECITLDTNLLPRARLTKARNSLKIPWGKEATVPKTIEQIMCTIQSNRFSFNILSFLYTAWDVEKQQYLEEWGVGTYWGGDLKRTKYICGRINSNTQEEAANALEWAVKWNRKFFSMHFLMSFNIPPLFILRHSACQGGTPVLIFR